EFDSISTGARSGPSTSTWIGQPSASIIGMAFPLCGFDLRPLAGAPLQRADLAVDEGLGGALIAHEFEQPRQFAGRELGGDARVLAHDLVQIALLRDRLAARVFDDLLRLRRADLG